MNFSLSLNAEFIESRYRSWKSDPNSVGRDWQLFFEGFEWRYPRTGGARVFATGRSC